TPEPAVPHRVRYRDLYRNSPLGVVAVAASGLISSIIFSMGPVYARLSGNGPRGVAAFMAGSILAAVLTQYPVGRLSDPVDRRLRRARGWRARRAAGAGQSCRGSAVGALTTASAIEEFTDCTPGKRDR